MRFTLALLSLVGCAAAQAVTALISPTAPMPAGCTASRPTTFELSIVSAASPASKRDSEALVQRQSSNGQLVMTLNNGVLKDSNGRQGYVASNFQFQFDGPPQAGAIYTAGFSICQNGTIALGGSAVWYSCSSGSSFDNLYDRPWAPYCKPVYFYAVNDGASVGSGSASAGGSSTTAAPTTPSASSSSAVMMMSSMPLANSTTTAAAGNGTMTGSSTMATMSSSGSGSSSGGSSSTGGASSGGASTPTPSGSQGAAAALATQAPQALVSWAFGVAGVLALL